MADDWSTRIGHVEAELDCRVPAPLIGIWTGATPTDTTVDVYLYAPDEIAERNTTYEIPTYRPDLLLIGDDGGGRGLFVARNDPDPDVIRIGLGAVGSDDGEPLGRLADLAADAFRSVPDEDTRITDHPPTGPIDILITHRPEAGPMALMEIRRLLGLQIPISQLTAATSFPLPVLTNVRYAKYDKAITTINQCHGCLSTRPHQD